MGMVERLKAIADAVESIPIASKWLDVKWEPANALRALITDMEHAYPHDPDGCATDECPCRTVKSEESVGAPLHEMMP